MSWLFHNLKKKTTLEFSLISEIVYKARGQTPKYNSEGCSISWICCFLCGGFSSLVSSFPFQSNKEWSPKDGKLSLFYFLSSKQIPRKEPGIQVLLPGSAINYVCALSEPAVLTPASPLPDDRPSGWSLITLTYQDGTLIWLSLAPPIPSPIWRQPVFCFCNLVPLDHFPDFTYKRYHLILGFLRRIYFA